MCSKWWIYCIFGFSCCWPYAKMFCFLVFLLLIRWCWARIGKKSCKEISHSFLKSKHTLHYIFILSVFVEFFAWIDQANWKDTHREVLEFIFDFHFQCAKIGQRNTHMYVCSVWVWLCFALLLFLTWLCVFFSFIWYTLNEKMREKKNIFYRITILFMFSINFFFAVSSSYEQT